MLRCVALCWLVAKCSLKKGRDDPQTELLILTLLLLSERLFLTVRSHKLQNRTILFLWIKIWLAWSAVLSGGKWFNVTMQSYLHRGLIRFGVFILPLFYVITFKKIQYVPYWVQCSKLKFFSSHIQHWLHFSHSLHTFNSGKYINFKIDMFSWHCCWWMYPNSEYNRTSKTLSTSLSIIISNQMIVNQLPSAKRQHPSRYHALAILINLLLVVALQPLVIKADLNGVECFQQ